MKKQVTEALSVLIGKPLWSCGRSAGLQFFQFGARITVTGFRGAKEVGDYSLHVQCAWRITRHDVIVAASGDIHDESSAQSSDDSRRTLTRVDESIQQLFQGETRQFVVEQIEAGHAGAFSITLADGYALDVMPDESSDCEHWRLFRPYVEGPHFVVTGAGLAQ